MSETTKQDGRRNNGLKPGENRGQGRKPADRTEGKRIKWALTFRPSHFRALKEVAAEQGISMVQVVESAIENYFENKLKKT
jgi:predicted HicB family RNase H-like nuclease